MYSIDEDVDYSQRNLCSFGSMGSGGADVTHTNTGPVVPQGMEPLANALAGISTGLTGSPVNFGKIPGLDAPSSGPLIPQPSMDAMFNSAPFMQGMNKFGSGNRSSSMAPSGAPPLINWGLGDVGASRGSPSLKWNQIGTNGVNWGDLFNNTAVTNKA